MRHEPQTVQSIAFRFMDMEITDHSDLLSYDMRLAGQNNAAREQAVIDELQEMFAVTGMRRAMCRVYLRRLITEYRASLATKGAAWTRLREHATWMQADRDVMAGRFVA